MKKILALALLLSFTITLLSLSNAHAATTIPRVIKPNATTVYCWLPHDIEITNPDATWCISGNGSVNIYNVTKAVNIDSHNEAIETPSLDIPVNAGKTVRFSGSGIHVIWVAV